MVVVVLIVVVVVEVIVKASTKVTPCVIEVDVGEMGVAYFVVIDLAVVAVL